MVVDEVLQFLLFSEKCAIFKQQCCDTWILFIQQTSSIVIDSSSDKYQILKIEIKFRQLDVS